MGRNLDERSGPPTKRGIWRYRTELRRAEEEAFEAAQEHGDKLRSLPRTYPAEETPPEMDELAVTGVVRKRLEEADDGRTVKRYEITTLGEEALERLDRLRGSMDEPE